MMQLPECFAMYDPTPHGVAERCCLDCEGRNDCMSANEQVPVSMLAGGFKYTPGKSALSQQVGGDHYRTMNIQPIEYIHANNIPFVEGAVIKYVSRWRAKGGIEDLRKSIHLLQLLIELEERNVAT